MLFISFFHQGQTSKLYAILLQGSPEYIGYFLKFFIGTLGAAGITGYLFHLLMKKQLTFFAACGNHHAWGFVYVLPPLWGFAFYFCAIHSLRHFKSIYRLVDVNGALGLDVISILVISFVTISAILGAALILPDYDYNQSGQNVFIGLAALTVPHMLLIDFFPHRAHALWVWFRGLSYE